MVTRLTRRALLAAGGASGLASLAVGQDTNDNQGNLYGGTMALDQAYNVAGDLWIGPDSAKSDVDASDGRVYMAADTEVEYYGDGDAWVRLGVGTDENPVPQVTSESVSTDEVNNTPQTTDASKTAAEINALLDELVQPHGGHLRFAPGEYGTDATVELANHEKLWGAGNTATRLKATTNLDGPVVEVNDEDGVNFFAELQDIQIHANEQNRSGDGTRHGIYLTEPNDNDVNDYHMVRAMVGRAPDTNLLADDVWGYHVTNSLFEFAGDDGIKFASGNQFYLDNIFSAYNGSSGVNIIARKGALSNINSRDNGLNGFHIQQPDNRLTNLFAFGNDIHGIKVSSSNLTISNSIVKDNGQAAGVAGVQISGADNSLSNVRIYAPDSAAAHDPGLEITGSTTDNTLIKGCRITDSENEDIIIDSGPTETVIEGCTFGSITDNGTRSLINGRGTNSGDPSAGGQWNGHASYVYEMDATIEDTTNGNLYKAMSDGTWTQIG